MYHVVSIQHKGRHHTYYCQLTIFCFFWQKPRPKKAESESEEETEYFEEPEEGESFDPRELPGDGGTQTIGYVEQLLFHLRRSQSRQKGKAPSSEHYTNTDGVPPHKKPKPLPKDNRKKDPTYAPPLPPAARRLWNQKLKLPLKKSVRRTM